MSSTPSLLLGCMAYTRSRVTSAVCRYSTWTQGERALLLQLSQSTRPPHGHREEGKERKCSLLVSKDGLPIIIITFYSLYRHHTSSPRAARVRRCSVTPRHSWEEPRIKPATYLLSYCHPKAQACRNEDRVIDRQDGWMADRQAAVWTDGIIWILGLFVHQNAQWNFLQFAMPRETIVSQGNPK
jgi:hypothetical protein